MNGEPPKVDNGSMRAELTRAEIIDLKELLRERESWKRVRGFGATLAKALVAIAAGIAVIQSGWSTVIKWLIK